MPEQFLTPEERRKLWEYRSRVMHDGVAKAVFTRSEAEEFNRLTKKLEDHTQRGTTEFIGAVALGVLAAYILSKLIK